MPENFGEKPPVSKTPEEKEQDRQEWKRHFGIQAEMAEEAEKNKKEFVEKMAKGKEGKRLRGWREHFGPLAELQEEAEKTPKTLKSKETIEPVKTAEQEREKLMKTELDPEWVLGKERANLAKELGERMRAKSAGEIKAAEKESPQKQEKREKQEKAPFSLKGFLRELDMQQTLKLVEAIEKFAKREKTKEKSQKEPAAKQEKVVFSLKRFLEELDMQQTLKLVEAIEKAVKKEKKEKKEKPEKSEKKPPFSLQKFLEKRRWGKIIKDTEKLREKIEKTESEKKPSVRREKPPISLKEVFKKLGMVQALRMWKSAEEFTRKRRSGESWGKLLEKIEESKRDMKWRLKESKWRLEDWLEKRKLEKKKFKDTQEVKMVEKSKEEPPEKKTEVKTEEVLLEEPPKEPAENPPENIGEESYEIASRNFEKAGAEEAKAWDLYKNALLKYNNYSEADANQKAAFRALSDAGVTDAELEKKYNEAVEIISEISEKLAVSDPNIAKLNDDWLKALKLKTKAEEVLDKFKL